MQKSKQLKRLAFFFFTERDVFSAFLELCVFNCSHIKEGGAGNRSEELKYCGTEYFPRNRSAVTKPKNSWDFYLMLKSGTKTVPSEYMQLIQMGLREGILFK